MAKTQEKSPQEQLVDEAMGFAAEQRFQLRKAIKQNQMEAALRFGLALTNELRSNGLLPESYHSLYVLIYGELQQLAAYVGRTEEHGMSLSQIYQIVQHEGSVLPRLYLLVTVGAVYIRQHVRQAREVIADLVALLSAVQHPMRGLFLRYYLLQMMKDKLLWHLGLRDTLQFLLSNFVESSSLWVRLPDVSIGETEVWDYDADVWHLDRLRCSLRLLVGAPLIHLARLPSLTVELYEEVVLPVVARRSSACDDPSGKAYLLDCFIQVFPDHYHTVTLPRILNVCAEVHWVVDLTPLLKHLMRRLTAYLRENPEAAKLGVDVFYRFQEHFQLLHKRPRSDATPLASLLELQLELLFLTLALHPGDGDRVDSVLGEAVKLVNGFRSENLDLQSIESVVNLLAAPLTQEDLVPLVLAMPHHASLIHVFDHMCHQDCAVAMVSAILAGDVALRDCQTLERLFALIDPLIHDQRSDSAGGVHGEAHHEFDAVASMAQQGKIARLAHHLRHPDPAEAFKMLLVARRYFGESGPHRLIYTLPSVVVTTLKLVTPLIEQYQKGSASTRTVSWEELFNFIYDACEAVSSLQPEDTLPLWLLCATTANRASQALGSVEELGSICGKLIDRALRSLEEHIQSQSSRFRGLSLVVGSLREIQCLPVDVYISAANRAVDCGTRLIAKRFQSKAQCLCTTLFWSPACRESRLVLRCLRRALQLADAAVHDDPLDIVLFVEALNRALSLHDDGNEAITPKFLTGTLALCSHHLRYIEGRATAEVRRALAHTASRLQKKVSDSRFVNLQTELDRLHVLNVLP